MTTTLKFAAKTHRYWLDGKPIPGVTTLIGKGLPKPALPRWAAKCVAEYVADNDAAVETLRGMGRGSMVDALKQVPWTQRDQAAARGTDVHRVAEQVVHGREVEVPDYIAAHVEGYVNWLDASGLEPILTERPVAHRKWWYAGTFDLIARLWDQTWLLDIKTATGVYGDNAVQLAAYAGAEFYVDHDDNEQPLPKVDRLGVLHVTDAGTQLYPVTDPDGAWKDWLHIAWVGKAEDRIKSYIGSPITPSTEDAA